MRLLRVYRLPATLFLLLAVPGANNLFWFNPHGLPLVGLVLVNCLPLCTIYVLICLTRLHFSLTKENGEAGLWRHSLLSLAIYLVALIPVSFLTVASLGVGEGKGYFRVGSDRVLQGHDISDRIRIATLRDEGSGNIGFHVVGPQRDHLKAVKILARMKSGASIHVPFAAPRGQRIVWIRQCLQTPGIRRSNG